MHGGHGCTGADLVVYGLDQPFAFLPLAIPTRLGAMCFLNGMPDDLDPADAQKYGFILI